MRRTAFWLIALVAAALVIAALSTAGTSATTKRKAPAFKLTGIDGKEVSLAKYQGKVIILDFWATWCPSCRAEIPEFVSLQKQYVKQGLVTVGLSLDNDSDPNTTAANFYKANKMNYPVAIADETLANKYGGIQYIPTTFVINRSGEIVQKFVGGTNRSVLENSIRPLL